MRFRSILTGAIVELEQLKDWYRLELVPELAVSQTTKTKKIEIEDIICYKLKRRAELGLEKYGVTLLRDDLTTLDWLIHAQEEALDLTNYLEVLIQHERDKICSD